MPDIERESAPEARIAGDDRASGPPDRGQGSLRRRQWSKPTGKEGTDGRHGGADGSSTTGDEGVGRPTAAGTRARTPRQFVIMGAVGLGVVAAIAGTLWVASSPTSGAPGISTIAAGSTLASSAAPAPSFSALAGVVATPSATPTKAVPASTAPTTKASAAKQEGYALAPWPNPIGVWDLNEKGGNTAYDIALGATAAQNGTAVDGWYAGGSCLFSGTSSQIYTNGPVLATGAGKSFTISAWVYLNTLPATPHDETAVSQDANENSAFSLKYSATWNRWEFSRYGSDTAGATEYAQASVSAPTLKTWTHLVGTFDASQGTETLYVNGVEQPPVQASPKPFVSSGDFVIGRGRYDGKPTDWYDGAIKDVSVWDVSLNARQVGRLPS